MWEKNSDTLYLPAGSFYPHEERVLACGSCSGFLPMSFLHTEHGLSARYERGGFTPLSGFRIERTEDALYLLERTVLILRHAPEHLLIPERIYVRTDTVFYSKKGDHLRIAYLPKSANAAKAGENPALPPLQKELIFFLAQLRQDLCDDHADLIARLAKEIYYNRPDMKALLRTIGLMRRALDCPSGVSTTSAILTRVCWIWEEISSTMRSRISSLLFCSRLS